MSDAYDEEILDCLTELGLDGLQTPALLEELDKAIDNHDCPVNDCQQGMDVACHEETCHREMDVAVHRWPAIGKKKRGTEQEDLSAYELERLEQVRLNREKLVELGLETDLKSLKPTRKKNKIKPQYTPKRNAPRSTRCVNTLSDNDGAFERQYVAKYNDEQHNEICTIPYDTLPHHIQSIPLNTSNSRTGYLYVHKAARGYQVQVSVNNRLVHHGIFADLKTAALAQKLVSNDTTKMSYSNAGRALIENMFSTDTEVIE